jgi:hypothetical protein
VFSYAVVQLMSTTEKPTLRMRPHDEAIFVARDGRRARLIVRAAVLATVLAVLWIVGLGIGMLGFDSLPGVSLVKRSSPPSPVAPVERVPAAAQNTARELLSAKAASTAVESARARSAVVRSRAQRRAAAKKASAAAVNPAQQTRGWARRGSQAPPGQVRKAAPPPPPPATSRGRHVGQTPATPPPAPPGQVKKALDPPPPPPKKG